MDAGKEDGTTATGVAKDEHTVVIVPDPSLLVPPEFGSRGRKAPAGG
jgi:hypothetical protein